MSNTSNVIASSVRGFASVVPCWRAACRALRCMVWRAQGLAVQRCLAQQVRALAPPRARCTPYTVQCQRCGGQGASVLCGSRFRSGRARLTPPSSGHTTAGGLVPLRQQCVRRCMPLMSNVMPHRGLCMRCSSFCLRWRQRCAVARRCLALARTCGLSRVRGAVFFLRQRRAGSEATVQRQRPLRSFHAHEPAVKHQRCRHPLFASRRDARHLRASATRGLLRVAARHNPALERTAYGRRSALR